MNGLKTGHLVPHGILECELYLEALQALLRAIS